jgi:hypothetical protein
MFLAVALVAIPFGWVAYQLNWIRERHSFLAEMNANGRHGHGCKMATRMGSPVPTTQVPWSLRIFRENGVEQFWTEEGERDAKWIAEAARLFPEAKIVPPIRAFF